MSNYFSFRNDETVWVLKLNSNDRYEVIQTTFGESDDVAYINEDFAHKMMDSFNKELDDGVAFVETCKDCGKRFVISEDEVDWFSHADMALPKSCKVCRGYYKTVALLAKGRAVARIRKPVTYI